MKRARRPAGKGMCFAGAEAAALLAYTAAAGVVGGLLMAWGDNASSMGFSGTSSPVQIGSARWLSVVTSSNYGNNAGFGHTLGIQSDGSLWAWGKNGAGQLGLSNTTDQTTPQKVGALSWKNIACCGTGETSTAVSGFSCGILTDGSLYTWGGNATGEIGDSTTVAKSSPVHVGTSSWNQVACGAGFGTGTAGAFVLAIRTDGGLFTWGRGNFGQLGNSGTTDTSSPVQVGALSWKVVSCYGNRDNNMAASGGILTDGSLYMWGSGQDGHIGDGTTVSKSSPVHIGASSWGQLAVGPHSLAIRTDGALFAWGLNNFGQLGDGTTASKSSPVAIGAQSWKSVAVNGGFSKGVSIPGGGSAAIRTDGLLFSWGGGTTFSNGVSSPVQVGAATTYIGNPTVGEEGGAFRGAALLG